MYCQLRQDIDDTQEQVVGAIDLVGHRKAPAPYAGMADTVADLVYVLEDISREVEEDSVVVVDTALGDTAAEQENASHVEEVVGTAGTADMLVEDVAAWAIHDLD